MNTLRDDFTRFEHTGWERVADKYDSVWSSLTRQFIPHLISAAQVSSGMSVLDVACGPGYVSAAVRELGAVPTGIDFSEKMIVIAKEMFPDIPFVRGDAKDLRFGNVSFDRVLVNFGLQCLAARKGVCRSMSRFEIRRKIWFCCLGWTGQKSGRQDC
jgi:ubiquinone/menaquinone biosynthesis C-methylase UbiE